MKTLLLIDGNSILNRAFYGIRPLTNSKGLYTQAVYGMMNIVLKHIEQRKPDYAAIAFDMKAPTFRHNAYVGYKANRKGMPEELAMQFPYAKSCMEALGLRKIELEGYEADDILGTCADIGKKEGLSVYILTGDRDSLQLIDDNVYVLLASTGDTAVFDREKFAEKYSGVKPEQFVDVKALMGDTSDNIPGVAGIGEKTALKLISDYGSLDGLYSGLDEKNFSPSVYKKLSEGKDSAYMSQFLARIKCDVPMGIDIGELEYKGVKRTEMLSLLTELELSSLIKRLGLGTDTDQNESVSGGSGERYSEKGSVCVPYSELREMNIRAGAVSFGDGSIDVFDGKKTVTAQVSEAEISDFFSDKEKIFTVEDSKAVYLRAGRVKSTLFDVTLAAYVADSSEGNYDISRLALKYLGVVLPERFCRAEVLFDLAKELEKRLEESGQLPLYKNIELPLAAVLADMENIGFKIDREGLLGFSKELDAMCREYKESIYLEAGHEFNINSTKQLGDVLFGELKLPVVKKTKTGYSTDAETLEKLRPYSSIIDKILEYRQVAKLKSTYTDGLLDVADGDGRIHSSFNQTVTATGRLSSSEPNLQNIPVRTELGRRLRKYFIPKNDEYVLIDADYSQIELRVLAAVAGDERMINAFVSGEDIHAMTASQVFGVPLAAVTAEQRKRAKAVNFGIIYGIGGYSLSQDIGVPKYEADRYIENYLAKYPQISEYLNITVEEAVRQGYATTIFGRRRYIPELSSPKKSVQAFGRRVAMNSPIQGAAADIIKIAMIRVDKALKESGIDARLILQVHDELILEAHHTCAKQAADLLKREMEAAVELAVPMVADVGIGDTWLDC